MQYHLNGNFKEEISFLKDADANVVQEFFQISLNLMNHEQINKKIYSSVASKLNTSSTTIENCIHSLMYLISQISKYKISCNDLKEVFQDFTPLSSQALLDVIEENRQTMDACTDTYIKAISFPRYRDLDWRIQYRMASRSLYDQCEPEVLLRIRTCLHMSTDVSVLLMSDVANIKHLKEELTIALATLNTRNTTKHINTL